MFGWGIGCLEERELPTDDRVTALDVGVLAG
jgi:hypothetical protein